MNKHWIIIVALFFIITPLYICDIYTQSLSTPLSYNSVLTIEPTAFPGKLIWTHGASRYVAAGAKPPYNHAELLVGPQTNLDQQIGHQFFIFQHLGNSTNIGPIDYGDELEILSPSGGYGDVGLAGLYVPMKKWWVNDGLGGGPGITVARQNDPNVYDIIVSDPNYPQTQDGSQIFKIISTTGCQGHVYPNDPIALISQGPRLCKDKQLWCITGSRIGSEFCEILASLPTNPQIATQGIFKIKTVDKATLSPEAQAMYALAQGTTLTPTGGSSFTFIPGVYGSKNISYSPAWKLQAAGKGSVLFSARAKADIYIALSSQPRTMHGSMYQLIIGENNNTKTTLGKGPGQQPIMEISKIKNPNVIITGGIGSAKGDGSTWDDYWIKYDSGTISFGKGLVVGKNVLLNWQEKNANNLIQYVGFGGNQYLVDFKDIAISDVYSLLNLPKGFDEAANAEPASAIAVGSRQDGTIEAWMIGKEDGAIYRYEPNSLAANAWIKLQMKDTAGQIIPGFISVAVSSDGVAGAVSTLGTAYIFDPIKNNMLEIPAHNASTIKFSKLTIGNSNNIWGLEQNTGTIYQLVKNKALKMADGALTVTINDWELRLQNCIDIAAGVDNTVLAITKSNQVSRYENQKWVSMPGVKLTKIAVGSKGYLWGTFKHDNIFEIWQCTNNVWKKVLGDDGQDALGFDALGVNAGGTVFANDDDGDLYNNGDSGVSFATDASSPTGPTGGEPAAGASNVKVALAPTIKTKRAIAKAEGKIPTAKKRVKKRVRKKIKRTGTTTMPGYGGQATTAQRVPTKLPAAR